MALKVAIVLLALVYIARRIFVQESFPETMKQLGESLTEKPFVLITVLLLMPLNWMLEALKWKILASEEKKVSFALALQGVLAGVTAGTASPNRIGEFAGRIFILPEGNRLSLLVLSAIASICQVLVTVIAGGWALLTAPAALYETSLDLDKNETAMLWFAVPVAAGIGLYAVIQLQRRKKINLKIRTSTLLNVFGLSAIRYCIYVLQFALLISLVAVRYDFWSAINAICICYLLVTIIPTFSVTEMLVRGSVAGIVFAETAMMGGKPDVIYIAILLWLINVAVPSLIGTVFVFRLKFFRQEDKP